MWKDFKGYRHHELHPLLNSYVLYQSVFRPFSDLKSFPHWLYFEVISTKVRKDVKGYSCRVPSTPLSSFL